MPSFIIVITARKRSLRRLCFYRCLSVHRGGACVVAPGGGGVRGCSRGACMVVPGACMVALGGVCVVLFGGACVVLFWGGVRGFIRGACVILFGGMRGFIQGAGGHAWFYLGGACMVLFGGHAWFYLGGVHGFIWGGVHGFFSFFGYNEIRSMSGRYASYWNAFLWLYCGWSNETLARGWKS